MDDNLTDVRDVAEARASLPNKPTKLFDFKPGELIFLTIAAILMPFAATIGLVFVLKSLNIPLDFLQTNIGSSIFAIVSELLYLIIVFWGIKNKRINWTRLGWRKLRISRALLYIVAGVGWYFLLTVAFSMVVQTIFPGFNSGQKQNIGIQNLQGDIQQILAFMSLAIVPPIAEEMLFRGFLFKGLRQKWPFWLSAVITSLMFAVAHGQLNVGLDVFALSLVLCYITDKTGSILPGIAIHALKNSFAYILLFTHIFPTLR